MFEFLTFVSRVIHLELILLKKVIQEQYNKSKCEHAGDVLYRMAHFHTNVQGSNNMIGICIIELIIGSQGGLHMSQ